MARTIADLHPDDHAARDRMRRQLRALREQQGISQELLGELMNSGQSSIRRLEKQGVLQSHTSTISRWARCLGHRLVVEPVGFPRPARAGWNRSRTPDAGMAALVAQFVRAESDDWMASRIVTDLVGIRLACCVSQERLAARLDVTEQAVSLFEGATADSSLVLLQRYARGVAMCTRMWRSAYLDVRLEPATPESSHSVDTAELVPSAG